MTTDNLSTYVVTHKQGYSIEVAATSYEDAANLIAGGTFEGAHARRTTGTAGKSGWFQAYRPTGEPGHHETSMGDPFHVS